MAEVELPDVRLCYERAGSGPRLLVISGTGSDLRGWSNPLRWKLDDHFDVVAYDHRGLGRSVPADPDAQPTMADFAADAIAFAAALGWETYSVFGISFGGMVAQEVAIASADRIERLVLACTSAGGAGGASFPLHEIQDLDPDARAAATVDAGDLRSRLDPKRRERAIGFVRRGLTDPTPGSRRQLEARRTHDAHDRLGAIAAPTLVAAGRHDGIAPLGNAEALAAAIPRARLQVFEGGHTFLAEDRTALPAVVDFLAGRTDV